MVLFICSFIVFTGFTTVNAETVKYFSAEEYTDSDKLLNYDGTSSGSETIFTFADEVHYAEMAAFIPDLSRVVPLQYLENDGTYSYFGKEYGFYMVVEDPYVDLLLVDISYELEDGKVYGIIRNLQVKIDNTYDFNLTGLNTNTAGGIVCYNESDGVIEDCSVSMLRGSNLGFTSVVGGIVGVNDGTIRDCWAVADVTTSGTFGVIAGANYGAITGCCGMGNIIQRVDTYEGCYELSKVGGIAGVNGTGGKISNCIGGTRDDSYLRVVIDVEYNDDENLAPYSGPIAGENKGEISNCSNYGYAIDTGNLHKWWAWFHDYDQLKNINNTI